MTEPTNVEPTEPTEPTTPAEPAQPSNSDIKGSELFQKVTGELAALKAEKAEREQAEADAKTKAEQEALTAKGDFETALKMEREKMATMEKTHKRELLQRDLTSELLKAGFQNDTFISGAVGGYNAEAGDVATYVQSLADNESNKVFLNSVQPQRERLPETGQLNNSGTAITLEQARQMKNSDNPEQRLQAAQFMREHWIKNNGKLP
jgi:hypothetical protein